MATTRKVPGSTGGTPVKSKTKKTATSGASPIKPPGSTASAPVRTKKSAPDK